MRPALLEQVVQHGQVAVSLDVGPVVRHAILVMDNDLASILRQFQPDGIIHALEDIRQGG